MTFSMVDKYSSELLKLDTSLMFGIDKTAAFIDDLTLIISPDRVDTIKEKTEAVKELVKDYLSLNEEMGLYVKAVNEMKRQIKNQQDENNDFDAIFQQKLSEIKSNHQKFSPENHQKYIELVNNIKSLEALNSENGVSQLLSLVEDQGGDLHMCKATVNIIDPITKKQMTDPVKSKLCNHTYERFSVTEHIKQKKGKARCPIGGCRIYITLEDLVSDLQLKKYIERLGEKS